MSDELNTGDLQRLESLLKKRLAGRMAWIQRDRALNQSSRNVGNAREYVETGQTLRRVLECQKRRGYRRLVDFHVDVGEIPDDVRERAGIGNADVLLEVCEKVHAVGNPHFPAGTLTDHKSVPGRPG